MMSRKLIHGFFVFCTALYCFFQPLIVLAAKEGEEKNPEWVLSYFLVLLCLGLAVLILLRPCNRSETAFTQEEIDQRKEEELKKLKKH